MFVVVEANTITDPWAMMIHLKNTLIALRAMMATIRLSPKATLAHTDTTIFLPLICGHNFELG